ncbi:hypothetical protein SeMB42_g01301 [Synchytrium endobioticum]|uniref:J domain-containing protein n=1 Tax=Synchytrium endobioticum TaxID=286115 RepID=A0A507D408_9FUNG|nr:hypothetical protein SeLEV6574_g03459 [Synchytrium endobioticum]TPX52599.1 hypothetical protein SeMB42_g01301 [Synchytrium endobioticum]
MRKHHHISSTVFKSLASYHQTSLSRLHQRHASTITNRRKRNFYEVLGIPPEADKKAIKTQFYKLSLEYHPDRNCSDDTAHAKFLEISEAYSVLGNDTKRSEYDRSRPGYRAAHGYTSTAGGAAQTRTGLRWGYPRENINPQDWILHRRSNRSSKSRNESTFDHTAHQEGHYGSPSDVSQQAREQARDRKRAKSLLYDEMFRQERSQPRFVAVFAVVLFGSFFLLHSGSMLFMEHCDVVDRRIRRVVEVADGRVGKDTDAR